MIEVPEGWRIDREERENYLFYDGPDFIEVDFKVVEIEGEDLATTTSARHDRRLGEWIVHPGSSTNWIKPNEARARAAALVMAANEAERRNKELA